MCGIVGFTSHQPAAPIILKGLQNLEYQGYDSTGMATLAEKKLWLRKGVGRMAVIAGVMLVG